MGNKTTTYLMLMSGIMMLFYFTGLLGNSPNNLLLNLVLNPEALMSTPLWVKVTLALQGVAATAVVIAGIAIGNTELAVAAPVAVYLFNLGWDFISVYQKVYSVNPVIASLFISPIFILYAITAIEWWRGRD